MDKNDFTHLHVHSMYSILDGENQIPSLVSQVKNHGMHTVALTDHGTMMGSLEFYKECKKQGVKPIIGVEAYITNDDDGLEKEQMTKDNNHLVMVAMNNTGLQNLMWLVSNAQLRNYYYKPRISKSVMTKENLEGIIATSACFVASTQVATATGFKAITDITEDDLVFNGKGQIAKVISRTSRNYTGQILEITTNKYRIPIQCTSDHKFFCVESKTNNRRISNTPSCRRASFKESPKWKEAGSLKAGDYLLMPFMGFDYGGSHQGYKEKLIDTSVYRLESAKYHLNQYINLDEELAEFMGWYTAEGSTNRGKVCFTLHLNESDEAQFIANQLSKLGLTNISIREREELTRIDVSCSSIELELWMNSIHGKGAANKRVPSLIWNADKNLILSYLRGLFKGDGYYQFRDNKYHRFVWATISSTLAKQIYNICLKLGLYPSLRISPAYDIHKEAFYLEISGNDALELQKYLKDNTYSPVFTGNHDYIVEHEGQKYVALPISSIEEVENPGEVYCLQMGVQLGEEKVEPSFLAEGFVVHNCLGNEVNRVGGWDPEKKEYTNIDKMRETAAWYSNAFGGRYYLEIQDNDDDGEQQATYNQVVIKIGRELDIPIVITADAHYTSIEAQKTHSMLMAMQFQKTLEEYNAGNEMKYGPWFYLRSQEEMFQAALKHNCEEAFWNACRIGQMCDIDIQLGKYKTPVFDITNESDYQDFLKEKEVNDE